MKMTTLFTSDRGVTVQKALNKFESNCVDFSLIISRVNSAYRKFCINSTANAIAVKNSFTSTKALQELEDFLHALSEAISDLDGIKKSFDVLASVFSSLTIRPEILDQIPNLQQDMQLMHDACPSIPSWRNKISSRKGIPNADMHSALLALSNLESACWEATKAANKPLSILRDSNVIDVSLPCYALFPEDESQL